MKILMKIVNDLWNQRRRLWLLILFGVFFNFKEVAIVEIVKLYGILIFFSLYDVI